MYAFLEPISFQRHDDSRNGSAKKLLDAISEEDSATARHTLNAANHVRSQEAVGLPCTTTRFHGGVACAEVIDGELCGVQVEVAHLVRQFVFHLYLATLHRGVQRFVPSGDFAVHAVNADVVRQVGLRQLHGRAYHLLAVGIEIVFSAHSPVVLIVFVW